MPILTPEVVQDLVAKAFCLEALSDKKDCTSRYNDLPGKPLEAFVLAGINSAPFFALATEEKLAGSKRLLVQMVPALKASNRHKSAKYVNMGLLEIMFPVVMARLACDDTTQVVKEVNVLLRNAPQADVDELTNVRKEGWKTSSKPGKNKEVFDIRVTSAPTPADFYERIYELAPPSTSSYQWAEQYKLDWPVLQELFNDLQQSEEVLLLDKIKHAFDPVRDKYPDVRIGILADMCAAAIFLHLSFQ